MKEQATAETLPAVDPIPEIVRRYLNGESLALIASEQGKSVRTIYNWLLTDKGAAYEDLITECLTNRVADADVDMIIASSSVSVARARETAKFARMDLERRRPKLYGQKMESTHDERITVIVQRERPQPVVVGAKTDEKLTVITDAQVIPQ